MIWFDLMLGVYRFNFKTAFGINIFYRRKGTFQKFPKMYIFMLMWISAILKSVFDVVIMKIVFLFSICAEENM